MKSERPDARNHAAEIQALIERHRVRAVTDPLFGCGNCGDDLSPRRHGWLTCHYCRTRVHTTCMADVPGRDCGCRASTPTFPQ